MIFFFYFLVVKFSLYLNRRVFVMDINGAKTGVAPVYLTGSWTYSFLTKYLGSNIKKNVSSELMHTKKIQTSQRRYIVWSGTLQYFVIVYTAQWFYKRTVKVLIRLRGCAVWSGPSLSAYARRHIFAWHDPWILVFCLLHDNLYRWYSLKSPRKAIPMSINNTSTLLRYEKNIPLIYTM